MVYKNGFIRLKKPLIKAVTLKDSISEVDIAPSSEAFVFLNLSPSNMALTKGVSVRRGEMAYDGNSPLFLSPFTGTFIQSSQTYGYLNRPFLKMKFGVTSPDDSGLPILEPALPEQRHEFLQLLNQIPGMGPLKFPEQIGQMDTLIISTLEEDPFIPINQYLLRQYRDEFEKAALFLRPLAKRSVLVVDPSLPDSVNLPGFEVIHTDGRYPRSIPSLVVRKVTGKALHKEAFHDHGIAYVGVGQLILLGKILKEHSLSFKIPVYIKTPEREIIANAGIGTPIYHLLKEIGLESYNLIIANSLFSGQSIHDLDTPVSPSLRSLILDYFAENEAFDNNCINCGECVRICPAKIQVNLLVRHLKNRQYENAESLCNLSSCLECGMCSFVCVSRIPIFQYIMLGKYEINLLKTQEELNAK